MCGHVFRVKDDDEFDADELGIDTEEEFDG
jgi:hypothetical protein